VWPYRAGAETARAVSAVRSAATSVSAWAIAFAAGGLSPSGWHGDADLAHEARGVELAYGDVRARGGERELGYYRHAHAGGDEALPGHWIVSLEGDVRLEPGLATGGGQSGECGSVPNPLNPRVVGELGHPDALAVRERMARRQSDVQAVLHKRAESQLDW
jgi:hypothetical protein